MHGAEYFVKERFPEAVFGQWVDVEIKYFHKNMYFRRGSLAEPIEMEPIKHL